MSTESIYIIGKFSYVIGNAQMEIICLSSGKYQAYEIQDGYTWDFKDKEGLLEAIGNWSKNKLDLIMRMTEVQ